MTKTKKTEQANTLTRAQKREATKQIIRELLIPSQMKNNDIIDEAARLFAQRFASEETENPNDVKGRIGSVLDVMKKEGEVAFDGGMYSLNTISQAIKTQDEAKGEAEGEARDEAKETPKQEQPKPKKSVRGKAKKEADEMAAQPTQSEQEKPVKPARAKKKTIKSEQTQDKEDEPQPLPAPPMQPIAPVAPITPQTAPQPLPNEKQDEKQEAKSAPKKRGRKTKTPAQTLETLESKPAENPSETTTETPEEKPMETTMETPVEKLAEKPTENPMETPMKKESVAPKGTLMDMSFLFGNVVPVQREQVKRQPREQAAVQTKPQTQPQTQPQTSVSKQQEDKAAQVKAEEFSKAKAEESPSVQKTTQTPAQQAQILKAGGKDVKTRKLRVANKRGGKALTADEKLQEAFIARLHKLGGAYFEYYSVYLLERYSRMNGRRLEALKITGGERDGGIDGEIELTDRLGFSETIYIQAKNWDPDKGDEKLWVVGETLLQQFIGACVCRQAKDGKQHCRGILITTSRFTPEAKRLLEQTSDKFVGYDANDLFEAAKECGFGLIKKNGEWALDENLLSGEKAFYHTF